MLDDLIACLIGGALGGRLSRRMDERKAARLRGEQMVQCSVRVLEVGYSLEAPVGESLGEMLPAPRLSQAWRQGTAVLSPGLIDFDGIQIAVRDLDRFGRQPSFQESWSSVAPGSQILHVHTDGTSLEWALRAEHISWAVKQVLPNKREGG